MKLHGSATSKFNPLCTMSLYYSEVAVLTGEATLLFHGQKSSDLLLSGAKQTGFLLFLGFSQKMKDLLSLGKPSKKG